MALSFRMTRSRKAIFFTLISILIVTMFVLYFRMQSDIPLKKKTEVIDSRITSLNDFVKSFEQIYAQRALYAMSHKTLNLIILHLNASNKGRKDTDKPFFVTDLSEAFEMAMVDGNIPFTTTDDQGNEITTTSPINEDENMQVWMDKLASVAKKELGITFTFTINDIRLEQDYGTGPWKARAVMEISYAIDSEGIARWERNPEPISVEFDITEFIDPYIAVMTGGYVNRKIYINRFNPKFMTRDNFILLAESGNYTFENYSAPSFLFRFEGNTSPSYCCGIESFVLPLDISRQDDGSLNPPPQCNDGLDNDADGRIDTTAEIADCDPPTEDNGYEYDSDEFGTDYYHNSYLDFQFWRGRCYAELGDEAEDIEAYKLPYDNSLWVVEDGDIYPGLASGLDFIKMDTRHAFEVYPNIGPLLTIEEYKTKYKTADQGGARDFNIQIQAQDRCTPVYPGCDDVPPH